MGLQVNGTVQPQPMNGVSFGQPTINYYVGAPKAGEPDSYQGKTLLGTVTKWGGFAAVIASALLFHKNIGAIINHKFPNFYKWCGDHMGKHIRGFFGKHSDSWYTRWTRGTKNKFADWGKSVLDWIKKPGVLKEAAENTANK